MGHINETESFSKLGGDEMGVDKDKLRELASDPAHTAASISEALGLGQAGNLYYTMKVHPELKAIYEEGRSEARNVLATSETSNKQQREKAVPPRSQQRSSSTTTPPPQRTYQEKSR